MFTCMLGRCCFHSLVSTQPFRRALTASVDSCAEIKSGVTSCGRGWRQVPECEAWSVLAAVNQQSVTTGVNLECTSSDHSAERDYSVNLKCTSDSHPTERDYRR